MTTLKRCIDAGDDFLIQIHKLYDDLSYVPKDLFVHVEDERHSFRDTRLVRCCLGLNIFSNDADRRTTTASNKITG